jgi:fatty-acyl-CoA synthase
MTVARITAPLEYWSSRTPDAIALECESQTMSWQQLHRVAWDWADRMAGDGLKPGDRVGYLTQNGLETIAFVLAGLAADLVLVPLNVRLANAEIAAIAEDAGLSAVLVDGAHGNQIAGAAELLPSMRIYWKGPGAPEGVAPLTIGAPTGSAPTVNRSPVAGPDAPAFLSYTSGTTGRPKAAILTHANFMAAAQANALMDGHTPRDTALVALPMAFTASLAVSWAPIYLTGGRVVLHTQFDAAAALADLGSGRISIFNAVPVVFESMAALPEFATTDFSGVRLMRSGGAASTMATLNPYLQRGLPLTLGWALTESTGVGCGTQPSDMARRPLSVGIPHLGLDLKVVDPEGNECPTDVTGQVVLRGPSVMSGYWKAPEITASTIKDGWLQTGDLGSLDPDGYLTLVGRSKDMFLSGAINVYPAEIERVIAELPGVIEVAVVGAPDDRWGHVPAAFVVTDPAGGPDQAMIKKACETELADYKRPRYIIFRDTPLPRTMSGKVQKSRLDVVEALRT